MKVLLLALLLPLFGQAQEDKILNVTEFLSGLGLSTLGVDSAAKPIDLPALRKWELRNVEKLGGKSYFAHYVRSDSLYYQIFQRYHRDSLPVIDFKKNDLVLIAACHQCLIYCRNNGSIQPCHRNVCMYEFRWHLQRKAVRCKVGDPVPPIPNGVSKSNLKEDKNSTITHQPDSCSMQLEDTSRIISLPGLSRSELEVLQDFGRYSSYVNIVSSDTLYYRLFQRFHRDSLPVIDFSKDELVLSTSCNRCRAFCKSQGLNKPCHRNACSYSFFWQIREAASCKLQASSVRIRYRGSK